MRAWGCISVLAILASGAVCAADRSDFDLSVSRAATCIDGGDWGCAFDALATAIEADPAMFGHCPVDYPNAYLVEDVRHLVALGYLAAENRDAAFRRSIAERGTGALALTSGFASELPFAPLRVEACAALGDSACVADSADKMRFEISKLVTGNTAEIPEVIAASLNSAVQEFDASMSIDVAQSLQIALDGEYAK